MKHSSTEKAARRDRHDPGRAISKGPDGTAIAPPAYGIDFIDQGKELVTGGPALQRKANLTPAGNGSVARPKNSTSLPDALKSGVESLSGVSLDDVRVHYNSPKPAGLKALAYTQGANIHVGPSQERHLPHEAWHVVQQKQGRVKPTSQMKTGVSINDNPGLEKEADDMGQKATTISNSPGSGNKGLALPRLDPSAPYPVQRKVGFEFELADIQTTHINSNQQQVPHTKGEILSAEYGYDITADINNGGSQLEFVTEQFDETDDWDMDKLETVAMLIELDVKNIIKAAINNPQGKWVRVPDVPGVRGGRASDILKPKINKKYADDNQHLPGQLQMTGGVNISALGEIASGAAVPTRDGNAPGGTVFQDYALSYQTLTPHGQLAQPVFQAAAVAAALITEIGPPKGISSKVRSILAAVLTLMAQVPLNAYGELSMEGQAHFLARTDYSKILKLICDANNLHLDPASFAQALLSTINQISGQQLTLQDDIFPAGYQAAGQQLTGVSIEAWARSVIPTPGKYWGRWQGTDLITKKNFPGTQAQKNELRAFGGFGNKTDPGNKVILEWRNFDKMNVDQLGFVVKGLAEHLKNVNQ